MICTFCGPNVSCYEELYGDNPEIPFMIRFIGHENSVAIILFEMLIDDNNKDDDSDEDDYDYETKEYKKKSFIEETEILEKNLDKEIFEEDNSF